MTLMRLANSELKMWEDSEKLKTIKQIYGKGLTDLEFQIFCEMGKATNLNPFLREIWCVKYGDNPASIFIGRDGYRKSAQANPQYDYHLVDAVYEKDHFSVNNGEVTHTYTLMDRGKLIGAYAIAKRKNASKPNFVFVELREYSTGKSLWNPQTGKQATMIKKVAESQCFRMAFQELFSGTYDESEEDHVMGKVIEGEITKNSANELNEKLGLTPQYDLSQLTKSINESKSLSELEANFKAAYKTARSNQDHINVLTELKDMRKAELQQPQDLDNGWEEFKNEEV